MIHDDLIASTFYELYFTSMNDFNFKSLYIYPTDYHFYDMCVKNQYIIIILQHESDLFNEYFYWFGNNDQKNDAMMIIFDYDEKKIVYQENLKYTPYKITMVGSTILLEWEDNSKLLAYNIKHLL